MRKIHYRILGGIILLICVALMTISKLENDVLDFFTGMFTAVGFGLTFGLFPVKKNI
ncbi:hypothetical protein [Polaribacter reichenbachii]|uniref:hypothetical protein n=1 Tax=Polaribacter reichenbachii TaxID=996801 RepID=UPI0012FA01B7|nr:hypothetical protein [Polaribacter reichenbachii]